MSSWNFAGVVSLSQGGTQRCGRMGEGERRMCVYMRVRSSGGNFRKREMSNWTFMGSSARAGVLNGVSPSDSNGASSSDSYGASSSVCSSSSSSSSSSSIVGRYGSRIRRSDIRIDMASHNSAQLSKLEP